MKITINEYQFEQAFKNAGRGNQFSREALKALFEYLEECEAGKGEEIKLDVVALCCEFTEYEDIEEFQADYGAEYEDIDDIARKTLVIPVDDNAFIIQDF